MTSAIDLVERGYVPDPLVRWGIRRLLVKRLKDEAGAARKLAEEMRKSPVAVVPEKANEQHYEVPPPFFRLVLGKHLKYSSCYYDRPETTLDEAEARMLALTCERAGLRDGQDVLELGCGWGSLSLWMAANYPKSRIVSVSNSAPQKEFILARAKERGLGNLEVITRDMNVFDTERRFDRAVSVEMFEHMRNWEELMRRVSTWLRPGGRLFIHIFCHREFAYPFEDEGGDDWMARNFFSGGIMPSENLPQHFQRDLKLVESWRVDGTHYARTSEDWLGNMDRRRDEVLKVLTDAYGKKDAVRWFQRWRMFFLACAELWGYRGGKEWLVGHYLFEKPAAPES